MAHYSKVEKKIGGHDVEEASIIITPFCSNNCKPCYMRPFLEYPGGKAVEEGSADHERIIGIIASLARQGVGLVSFEGGDAAEYPRIGELIDYAHSLGLKTVFWSNTMDLRHMTPKAVEQVDYAFTTICGENAAAHDAWTRNPGVYGRLCEGLKTMAAHGKKIGLFYNMVPWNVDKIYEAFANLIKRGVLSAGDMEFINFQQMSKVGNAEEMKERLFLEPSEIDAALAQIARLEADFGIGGMNFLDLVKYCEVDLARHPEYRKYLKSGGCSTGHNTMQILGIDLHSKDGLVAPAGSAYACGAEMPRAGILGNVLEQSLSEIQAKSRYMKAVSEIEKYLPEKCRSCPDKADCKGGCPKQHFDYKGLSKVACACVR
jgi:radical SAM protein with 4Fe4S-binding SPASM domain